MNFTRIFHVYSRRNEQSVDLCEIQALLDMHELNGKFEFNSHEIRATADYINLQN